MYLREVIEIVREINTFVIGASMVIECILAKDSLRLGTTCIPPAI